MAVEFQSFSTQGICESRRQLHTPSSFARSSLLYVQEVGTLRSIRSHLSKRSHLDSFLFYMCCTEALALFPRLHIRCMKKAPKTALYAKETKKEPESFRIPAFSGRGDRI